MMAAHDSPSVVHAMALVTALQQVRSEDLVHLQRLATSGMVAGIEAGDRSFARLWQVLGRCARAERGRREQAVIDFVDDELDGPAEGCLADEWELPSGWFAEVDHDVTGGEYDGQ